MSKGDSAPFNPLAAAVFMIWLMYIPVLFYVEITKQDLNIAWSMSEQERKIHFLKRAMPGLGDDYFELLNRARERFSGGEVKYGFFSAGDSPNDAAPLPDYARAAARGFSNYWLAPARVASTGPSEEFELYYRKEPFLSGKVVIDKIEGAYPSYVVKTLNRER